MTTESVGGEETAPATLHSTLLTFLIADVRGYTRFTSEHGDEAAAALADRFAALCEEVLSQYDGQVIELRGDEALAVFSSARSALRGADALQHAFRQAVSEDPSLPLAVGMGLDAGEPIPMRGGFRGGALNLAARLCSIAGAGEILASEAVVLLARRTEGLAFVDRGHVTLKGLAAPVRVRQIAREGEIPAKLPPLQPVVLSYPTNLPDDSTPFVGREEEIGAVSLLLRDPHIRLVTLTGPAGTGKTRLALQAGSMLLYDFPDGVFFCELSGLSDPALVPSALAQVLQVKETSGADMIEVLAARLAEKHMLIILDNFEHLLDAGQSVAALLEGCRDLHMLLTSRIPLHVSREHEHAVPPLTLPDPGSANDAASLSGYESVALFVQRARAAKDSFTMTDENAPAIGEICSRLDGLPLAIELAAARIKLFPPQALLQRLSRRLTLLTGGARDRPARQQTLRAAIDWSFSLLTADDQILFARLAVFAGGWSYEAAETVCNQAGALDLLDAMASLVDKSLVRQTGEDEPRFSMLETIREYAGEKLDGQVEAEEVREAHARYFLALAVEANRFLGGPDQVRWLDRLEHDHDNLRGALRWAISQADAELAMNLALNLSSFWYLRGYFNEGRALCDELLALPSRPELATLRAEFLEAIAVLPLRQGDYTTARAFLDEGLEVARQVGDPALLAMVLSDVGFAARLQGDYAVARSTLEEALEIAWELTDTTLVAKCLHHLGLLAMEADHDLETAWAQNEQSVAMYRGFGNQRMVAAVLGNMARVARGLGDLTGARALVVESVTIARDVGDLGLVPQMLYALAAVEADMGEVERAVRVQGAATNMETIIGIQVWPVNRLERDAWLGWAHDELGEAAFVQATAEGRAMTVDQTMDYALQDQ